METTFAYMVITQYFMLSQNLHMENDSNLLKYFATLGPFEILNKNIGHKFIYKGVDMGL